MYSPRCVCILLAFGLHLGTSSAAPIVLSSVDNGWYSTYLPHQTGNTNTITGYNGQGFFNSFYRFVIPSLAPNELIVSARLTFFGGNGRYDSQDSFETLEIRDVTTQAGDVDGRVSEIFNDLQSGAVFGSVDVFGTSGARMPEVNLLLNAAALQDIAGDSDFRIGAHLTTDSNAYRQALWAFSDRFPAAQLTLDTVTQAQPHDDPPRPLPSPGTLSLVALAMTIGVLGLRRRMPFPR